MVVRRKTASLSHSTAQDQRIRVAYYRSRADCRDVPDVRFAGPYAGLRLLRDRIEQRAKDLLRQLAQATS